METKDLKIGNYINRNYGNIPIVILEVLSSRISYNNPVLSGKSVCADLKGFSPIQLNNEWMLNFGFYALNDSCGYRKEIKGRYRTFLLTVFLSHDIDGNEVWCENHADITEVGEGERFCSAIPLDINYVHQLQNLYYSITGKELKLTTIK